MPPLLGISDFGIRLASFCKFLKKLFLSLVQALGRSYDNLNNLISPTASPEMFYPPPTYPENLTGVCPWRDIKGRDPSATSATRFDSVGPSNGTLPSEGR